MTKVTNRSLSNSEESEKLILDYHVTQITQLTETLISIKRYRLISVIGGELWILKFTFCSEAENESGRDRILGRSVCLGITCGWFETLKLQNSVFKIDWRSHFVRLKGSQSLCIFKGPVDIWRFSFQRESSESRFFNWMIRISEFFYGLNETNLRPLKVGNFNWVKLQGVRRRTICKVANVN